MKLTNSFEVPMPVEEAWPLLMDIERIVPCVPGAELVETIEDDTFKGKVSVRLGPVTLAFDGIARFTEIDDVAYQARMEAQGTDRQGRGGAQVNVDFRLESLDDDSRHTQVLIDTDLNLSGSIAQYGRASGMIADVAAQIIDQFASCLHRQIAASHAASENARESGTLAGTPLREPASPKPVSILALVFRAVWNMIKTGFGRLIGH